MTDPMTPLTEEAVRAARKAAGMTLRTAASLLHIDFTYLSKVENGHERPSDALLLRMGEIYGFEGPAAVLARKVAEVPPDVRAVIEAAAARRALEGSGVVEALRKLLDAVRTDRSCLCNHATGKRHRPWCPVVKADEALAALPRPVASPDPTSNEITGGVASPEEPRVEHK